MYHKYCLCDELFLKFFFFNFHFLNLCNDHLVGEMGYCNFHPTMQMGPRDYKFSGAKESAVIDFPR